ncbi:MAG: hypothetical protein U9R64_09965, partial [Pseudomonadota bacterium]|nr:hypothetical protein [Pseudomonadota bacterium]
MGASFNGEGGVLFHRGKNDSGPETILASRRFCWLACRRTDPAQRAAGTCPAALSIVPGATCAADQYFCCRS